MQDALHLESAVLKHMTHDQPSMTSSNGKLNDAVPTVSQSDVGEVNQDETNISEERLKLGSVPSNQHIANNEALNTSLGSQSINQNLLWSGTSASDENYRQSIHSMNNGEIPFQQFQTSAAVNVSRPIYNSSVANAALTFPSNHVANTVSQQGRRAITGHNTITNFPRQPASFMMNTCNNPKVMPQWNNSQMMSWPTQQPQAPIYPPWNMQQHRSTHNINPVGPGIMKKQTIQQHLHQQSYVTPTKYKRNAPVSGQIPSMSVTKCPYDFSALEEAVKMPVNMFLLFDLAKTKQTEWFPSW